METKLCKDCRHCCSRDIEPLHWTCQHPKYQPTSLVTGKGLLTFCENQRHALGQCGVDGKGFEPKEQTQ